MSERYRLSFSTGGLFLCGSSTVAACNLLETKWNKACDQLRKDELLQFSMVVSATCVSEMTARVESLVGAFRDNLVNHGFTETDGREMRK